MRKQMLIIKGPGNVGKSTVLREGFKLLFRSILRKQKPTCAKFLYLTDREVAAVICIGATRVGISTRGDNRNEVKRALSFFSEEKCQVVVCATRSRGAPYGTALDFAFHRLKIEPTELIKESEGNMNKRELADKAFTRLIYRWVTKALNSA